MTRLALSLTAALADMDCEDFTSHAEAQAYFERHGGSAFNNVDLLDEDGDGLACEWGPVDDYSSENNDSYREPPQIPDEEYYDPPEDDPVTRADIIDGWFTLMGIGLLLIPIYWAVVLVRKLL